MSDSKGFYQASTFLGQHFKISQGILKRTACMALEERVLIADLEAMKKVLPWLDKLETLDLSKLIDKVVMPFIENEGYAKWMRDVVTDMAIKKGDTRTREKWKTEGDSEIIEDEPKP